MPDTINSGNFQNEAPVKSRIQYSTIPLKETIFSTERFGEYSPFWWLDSVPKDNINQRSVVNNRSFTLKAPLMENINMKRDYFSVDYAALLPLNWDKIYKHPKIGDDIDAAKYGSTVVGFAGKTLTALQSQVTSWGFDLQTALSIFSSKASWYATIIKSIVIAEYFLSKGSLLSHLGINISDYFDTTNGTFDEIFDKICRKFVTNHAWYNYKGKRWNVSTAKDMRLLLERIRDGWNISELNLVQDLADEAVEWSQNLNEGIIIPGNQNDAKDVDVNLAIPAAYQITCAHFYSNDNIDYIYSADLWRQLIGYYITDYLSSVVGTNPSSYTFSYNGIDCYPDWLSAQFYELMLSGASEMLKNSSSIGYLSALFSYKRSLRFEDYFVGARSKPLAVGNVNVSVEGDQNAQYVSVIDITKNIARQRFLNNVNRMKSRIEGYISDLFDGVKPPFDYHNPAYLGHTTDTIFAAELENTGEAQQTKENSITANFRGQSSNFQFNFNTDRPCIYIGIQYFDIPRAYANGVSRIAQHVDRFDMFNPELQYIGDQEVRGSELLALLGDKPISYHTRNAEYKQAINRATGGFAAGQLSGWAFIFQIDDYGTHLGTQSDENYVISPDFIRSHNVELDDFYLSLTGFSLGTYYHFIQKTENDCTAKRPMALAPQIL